MKTDVQVHRLRISNLIAKDGQQERRQRSDTSGKSFRPPHFHVIIVIVENDAAPHLVSVSLQCGPFMLCLLSSS